MATISSDKVRAVKVILETGKMVFHVENAEFGTAIEELEVDYEGDSLEIGFIAVICWKFLHSLIPEAELYLVMSAHVIVLIKRR